MFLHLLSNDSSSFTDFMREVPIDNNEDEEVSVKLGFSNNQQKNGYRVPSVWFYDFNSIIFVGIELFTDFVARNILEI